jgi:hypothetical protein
LAPHPENPAHDHYGNTTWFYLYSVAPVHDPTLYRPLPEFHVIDASNQQWNFGVRPEGNAFIPLVGVNSAQLFMVFHPDHDRFAVLGWRSPYTGKISVDLDLQFPDPIAQAHSNGIIWSLDREGSSILGDLLTPGNQARGSTTLDVNTGDSLYLVINDAGDTNSDTIIGGFRIRTIATISPSSAG